MIYRVDIDNTICRTDGADYGAALPVPAWIEKINALYDGGHYIEYWTARGVGSGCNWERITRVQLRMWGCRYHELHMDKPVYDVIVDDRAKRIEEL